jgi:hypothetical protein
LRKDLRVKYKITNFKEKTVRVKYKVTKFKEKTLEIIWDLRLCKNILHILLKT